MRVSTADVCAAHAWVPGCESPIELCGTSHQCVGASLQRFDYRRTLLLLSLISQEPALSAARGITLMEIGASCQLGARDCCDGQSVGCNLFCSTVDTSNTVCTRYCAIASDCGNSGYTCMPSDDGYGVCAIVSQWWMIGMAFCFGGTVISNLGSQFQKVALREHKKSM
eukprot:SAG31_NODE_6738_length_1904_cov_8.431579_2_plen_167_part_01